MFGKGKQKKEGCNLLFVIVEFPFYKHHLLLDWNTLD